MRIAIGSDPNASALKHILLEELLMHEVKDFGSDDPVYANVALEVAKAVARGEYDRGILLCGTGLGVALAANKVKGAYATPCSDVYSAERSILSNNANILTMGSLVTGPESAKRILRAWLSVKYEPGGRSEPKIRRIYEQELEQMGS